MKIMIIYKATNKLTNESYVGKSIKSLAKRKSDHKYEAFVRQRKSKFYRALREFGWENFDWTVIGHTNTYKNLKLLERKFIIELNTIDEGYNSQIR